MPERLLNFNGYAFAGEKELILIPTPGQSEQEYLAKYWKEKFGAEIILQKEIKKLNSLKA